MLSLQDKGKNLKDINFYHNADEMKKKVISKPLMTFFSKTEDVTVDDVRDI